MMCKIKVTRQDIFALLVFNLADYKWNYEVIPNDLTIYVFPVEKTAIEAFVEHTHLNRDFILISEC